MSTPIDRKTARLGWAMLRRAGLSQATIEQARREAKRSGISEQTAERARLEAPLFRGVKP